MHTRRALLKKSATFVGASLLAHTSPALSQIPIPWRMPDEGEPHLRT